MGLFYGFPKVAKRSLYHVTNVRLLQGNNVRLVGMSAPPSADRKTEQSRIAKQTNNSNSATCFHRCRYKYNTEPGTESHGP
jgi:hypothetical protein